MGDVGNQGFDCRLFSFYGLPGRSGALKEPGQPALQGGQLSFIKCVLHKAAGDSPVQHLVQFPEGAPSGCPLPEAKCRAGSCQRKSAQGQRVHLPTSQT